MRYFLNEKYSFLKILFTNSVEIFGKYIVPLSQDQMARQCRYGKSKINQYLREFTEYGLIEENKNIHGRYILTEKAVKIISLIKTIEENNIALFQIK